VLSPGSNRHGGYVAALPLPEKLREYETRLIREALERNRFVGTRTARELGISESTLRYKLESLGIKPG
jgi:DNA-binding NtrC family response regulator